MATMVRLQTMIIVVLSVVVLALSAVLFVIYDRQKTLDASSPLTYSLKKDETPIVVGNMAQKTVPSQQASVATPSTLSPELDRYLQKAPMSKDPATIRTERQAERQMREEKMARLKDLQTRFRSASANGKTPDIAELDKLLSELVEIQGTSVIAGVDLNILRQNLLVAHDVQALAKELEVESKKPTPDQNRIIEITKEIQAMQGRLNTNIMYGGNMAGTVPQQPSLSPLPPAEDTQKDRKGL